MSNLQNSFAKHAVFQLIKAYFFLLLYVPCHKNLHLIRSILLITCIGTLHMDKVHKDIEDSTEFTKVSLPFMENILRDQFCNLFSNLDNKKF